MTHGGRSELPSGYPTRKEIFIIIAALVLVAALCTITIALAEISSAAAAVGTWRGPVSGETVREYAVREGDSDAVKFRELNALLLGVADELVARGRVAFTTKVELKSYAPLVLAIRGECREWARDAAPQGSWR